MINIVKRGLRKVRLFRQIRRLNRDITNTVKPDQPDQPVLFFNASSRLEGLSLNAAFAMISSWGIQLAGREVYHFACRSGMSHCVLAAGLGDPTDPPPCQGCIQYTDLFTGAANRVWFDYREDPQLREIISRKSIADLVDIEYKGRPLGSLVIASVRWILRRHNLEDDEVTRYLMREYILSANSIADEYSNFLDGVTPVVVVVYNGLLYPEAVVRWMSHEYGIRVITHEVNLQPDSAFFTEGQATSYQVDIPKDFHLSSGQNKTLDRYLGKRFKGDFEMAGIKFWSSMSQLPKDLLRFIDQYDNLVPVFTNVIFDTSQAYSNTLFPTMFEWLELVLETVGRFPDTLFVIRAHPDEMRKGKSSQESVLTWAEKKDLDRLPNLKIIGPDETLSSYELIQRSKFAMVYNSSIGLEATLLGKPVLCAGLARYTQYPIVFYPETRLAYEELLRTFLTTEKVELPAHFLENARRFIYYQLYRASLPFGEFLSDHSAPGYVQLSDISMDRIEPGASKVIDRIVNGILNDGEFILETDV